MQRVRVSWELGKISWSVLKSDRTLAWFPILSTIASLLVLGVFAGLVAITGLQTSGANQGLEGMGYVFIGVGYIAMAFVGTYFLAALVSAANERLEGRDSTVRESLTATNGRLHVILPWALVQGVVSIVISALENRGGWFGTLIIRMLGAAWAVLTYLTVPIIVLEALGPIAGLKRSGTLLKSTWGENLVGQAGFGILGMLASLPGLLVLALGIATGSVVVAVALGIVGVAWIVVVSIVISAMNGIYRTALYRFAVDGKAPAAFAGSDLGAAFGPRRGSRGIV